MVKSKKADKVEVRLEENRETEAQIVEETKEEPQSLTDVAGNALAAAKLALSMNTAADAGKIKVSFIFPYFIITLQPETANSQITETKEFAGQSVEVETVVDPNSKEGMALKRKAEMKVCFVFFQFYRNVIGSYFYLFVFNFLKNHFFQK